MPPIPRVPVGDLLAAPPPATAFATVTTSATADIPGTAPAGEFDELRGLVRVWCALSG